MSDIRIGEERCTNRSSSSSAVFQKEHIRQWPQL